MEKSSSSPPTPTEALGPGPCKRLGDRRVAVRARGRIGEGARLPPPPRVGVRLADRGGEAVAFQPQDAAPRAAPQPRPGRGVVDDQRLVLVALRQVGAVGARGQGCVTGTSSRDARRTRPSFTSAPRTRPGRRRCRAGPGTRRPLTTARTGACTPPWPPRLSAPRPTTARAGELPRSRDLDRRRAVRPHRRTPSAPRRRTQHG